MIYKLPADYQTKQLTYYHNLYYRSYLDNSCTANTPCPTTTVEQELDGKTWMSNDCIIKTKTAIRCVIRRLKHSLCITV